MYIDDGQRAEPDAWQSLSPSQRALLRLRVALLRRPRGSGEAAAMRHLAGLNRPHAWYALGLGSLGLAGGLMVDAPPLQVAFGGLLVLALLMLPGYLVASRR